MKNDSYGILIVASVSKAYYDAALQLIESISDHAGHARVCLAAHEQWVNDTPPPPHVEVMTPIPAHIRAKLWALPRTPFDRTLYVDADCYATHDDLGTVFDIEAETPILQTENIPYAAAVVYFNESGPLANREGRKLHEAGQAQRMLWHCGLLRYDKTPEVLRLLAAWPEMLLRHHSGDTGPWPKQLAFWDTFAYWRVLHDNPDLAALVSHFPDPWARWQFVNAYREEELQGQEPIIYHYTIPGRRIKASRLPGIRGHGDMEDLR